MNPYRKASVRSADGVEIGYRVVGEDASGPAVLLMHGGMLASQHMMKLAGELASEFTAYVPDRRGRGLSGPNGDAFGVMREVEDVRALVAATGASRIFGLSSGGLVALRAALATPELERVAVYEPPLSVAGSAPLGWTSRYEREMAAGKVGAALVTALKGLDIDPVLGRVPRFVLTPLMPLAMRLQRATTDDDVSIASLVPTERYDMQIVREMADTAEQYRQLAANVLLMSGTKSPAWLGVGLAELASVLPHARQLVFDDLDHSGPTDDGDPTRVGQALRDFFTA